MQRGKKSSTAAEQLGRSRGGLTTKIHARVDDAGRLFTLLFTPGQQHDSTVAQQLMRQRVILTTDGGGVQPYVPASLSADKAYSSRAFRAWLRRRGIQPVIPRKSNQRGGRPHNAERYKQRNHIEHFFGRLKQFRTVATRYDKCASSYLATLMLAPISLTL